MVRKVSVVIGACFGDEGKGRVVDHLANLTAPRKLVVRFNGGAQAGHHVVLPDGTSHIHQHFGSGAVSGHATYLDRDFICNPRSLITERTALEFKTGRSPRCFVHPQAMVTTPFDVFLNHALENSRGMMRHGSCGIGIGETVERYTQRPDDLRAGDVSRLWSLGEYERIRSYLVSLQKEWLPARADQLGLELVSYRKHPVFGDAVIDIFIGELLQFAIIVEPTDRHGLPHHYQDLIFEGAQGLMLDQDYGRHAGWFPHVTRSNTGLKNVAGFLQEIGHTSAVDVHYVTRSYMTRHGAGPFPSEDTAGVKALLDTTGETNIAGEFQGGFRYGLLSLAMLRQAIAFDQQYMSTGFQLDMTCLDQWRDKVAFIDSDGERREGIEALGEAMKGFDDLGLRAMRPFARDRRSLEPLDRVA